MVRALNALPSPVKRSAPVRKCARASCLGFPSRMPRAMDQTAACSSRLTRLSGTSHDERQQGSGLHKLLQGLQKVFSNWFWQQVGHETNKSLSDVSNYLAPCLLQDDRQLVHGQQRSRRLAAEALDGAPCGEVFALPRPCR